MSTAGRGQTGTAGVRTDLRTPATTGNADGQEAPFIPRVSSRGMRRRTGSFTAL